MKSNKNIQHLCPFFILVLLMAAQSADGRERLFPGNLPAGKWVEFQAAGFSQPVWGVIYSLDKPATCGAPLGGVDTGCIDLETSGLWGYSSLFNTHVPRRGPLNVPALGLSVGGKTWVLCDPKQVKEPVHWGSYYDGAPPYPDELKHEPRKLALEGVIYPREIHYWGHFPMIDMEFETDAPVHVGLRAWSPFLPGDVESSMIPGSVFEVCLRNVTDTVQESTLVFNFPGPLNAEAGTDTFERETIAEKGFNATVIRAMKASYLLGVAGKESVQFGGPLGAEAKTWQKFAESVPKPDPQASGTSAVVKAVLQGGETRIIRFVLSWLSSQWKGGGHNWSDSGHTYTHMYAARYPDVVGTARLLANNHQALLQRIIDWQSIIYGEKQLPGWLRDSLINILYMIPEDGMWAQAQKPVAEVIRAEDGLFGMNECPRGCPQIECIPCSFYGNQPLVYFFPELALSSLRGYKAFQKENGDTHWTFGGLGKIDFALPNHGYQTTLNGISYTSMVDRYAMCWGDREFDREFYDSVKRNAIFTVNLRPIYEIGDAIISMPKGNIYVEGLAAHWFEAPEPGWFGMVPHVGGLHLAQLQIAQRMAQHVGDDAFAQQCEQWIAAGSKSLEAKTWLGTHYLTFWEPESDKRSDYVFGYQLDGEWVSDFHGLGGVFRKERVDITLDTLKRCNVALSRTGAVNYAHADGKPAPVGGYGTYSYFPPELLMLAMNYMYEGRREYGMELARRCWENLVCQWGYTWDMPNIMRGDQDTGERKFGNDYYQDMMLWSLPAAIAGQGFDGPAKSGGLVDRVIKAARGDQSGKKR